MLNAPYHTAAPAKRPALFENPRRYRRYATMFTIELLLFVNIGLSVLAILLLALMPLLER